MLRTIALRLTGTEEAKEQLAELGEETDGVVTTTSKLRDTILAATKVESNAFKGFDILDDNGNYKSTYEIMLGIAEIYEEIVESDKKLGDNKANLLLETVAGKNRSNIAASIFQSPETLKKAYEQSKFDSEGSAQNELDKYLESLEAKIQQFKNALQELAATAIDSGFLGGLIDFGTGFVKVLDAIIERFGTIQTLFAAFYGFSFLKQGMMNKGIIEKKTTFAGSLPDVLKKVFLKSDTASAGEATATALSNIAEEGVKASTTFSTLATSSKGFFAGLGSGVKTLWSSLNVLGKFTVVGLAVGAGLKILGSVIDYFHESTEEMIEKSEQAAEAIKTVQNEFKKTENTVSTISERFAKLAQGVDMLSGKNISLSDSEYAEFLDLSNQLAEIFPTLSRNYDENGNAIVQLSGDTDTMVGSLQALLDVERQLAAQKIVDELPDLYKGAYAKSKPIEEEINNLEAQRDALNREYKQLTSENFIEDFSNSISNGILSIKNDNLEQLYAISNDYKKVLDELGLSYTELTPDYGYNSDGIQVPVGVNIVIDSFTTGELDEDEVKEKSLEISKAVQGVASEYNNSMNKMFDDIKTKQNENKANWSSVLSGISTWLSTDVSSYGMMSDEMQSVAQSIIGSLDFGELDYSNWDDFSDYLKEYIVDPLASLKGDAKDVFMNAWTELSSLDVKSLSATDYVKKVNSYLDTIANSLGMDEEKRNKLAINLGFDIDFTTEKVDEMKEDIKKVLPNVSKETIDGFTLAELNIAVKVADDAAGRVDKEVDKILEAERVKLESEMLELQKGGSVNLMLRSGEDYNGTIRTYKNDDKGIAMNFTPVMVDPDTGRYIGTLSSSDLEKYANEVMDGVHEDDKNLKIGATFEGEDAVKQAEKAAKRIKVLKKDYYDNVNGYFDGKADVSVIKKATDNALKRQMDIYKYLGEEAMVDAQDIMNNIGIKTIEEKMQAYEKVATTTVDLFTTFTKTGNAFSVPINGLLDKSISHYNENVEGVNSAFVQNVDGYIDKANELKVALGKLSDGTLQYSDLDRLKDLGVETDNIQELDDSIRNMLDGMNSDMFDSFISQFGKVDSAKDRRELEKFMTTVLKLGSVVGSTKFDISIETQSQSYENLATAMQESVTATGLTSESISNLQNRYEELEAYDAAKLFEKTANGIHLNRQELNKLEAAYKADKTEMITDKVDELKKEYASLMKQIDKCSDPSVLQALYSRRDALVKEMQTVAETASQYSGLASAYNRWQMEQAAGNERDMYEGVLAGFDEVKKEMQRGWFDDDTVAFLELLSGEDLSTAPLEKQIEAYEKLDDAINSAGYSVKDFFTKNSDDESTSVGVFNFLDAVNAAEKELGADLVTIDPDGNYSFDFAKALFNVDGIEYEGDAAVAKVLGISEELVQIILRAADDAGFVIDLEGAFTQLTQLKSSAEEAADALKTLKGTGYARLTGLDLDFDFEATGDGIKDQLTKAQEVLDRYKVDGKVDMEIKGAKEATELVYYFATMWDKLNEPAYMNLNVSDVEEELQEPLEKLQEFEELTREQYRLELVGDTEGVKEIEKEMDEIVKYIEENDELKAQLKVERLTSEQIKQKLIDGEIEFPATAVVDLQVEISDTLKDIKTLLEYEKGIIEDENELNLKVKYNIDDTIVEDFTKKERTAVVKFFENHEEVDKYNPDVKEGIVKFVAKNQDFNDWEEEEQNIAINYYTNDVELLELSEEELDYAINFTAETGLYYKSVEEIRNAYIEDKIVKLVAEDEATSVLQLWNSLSADDKFTKLSAEDQATYVINLWNSLTPEEKQAYMSGELTLVDNATAVAQGVTEEIEGVPLETVSALEATDSVTPIVLNVSDELDDLNGKTARTYIFTYKKTITESEADGTAHASGTAKINKYSSAMSAYAKGTDWRLPQNEDALVNEVGQESIVRDGRWFPIPGGAHIEKLRKGDIIK